MKSNLKIILVLLIIGEIFSVRMMYKSYNNETIKENVEEIPKKQFAIKVDNGSGKYEDSTSFPGKGYYLNMSLTECKDQMGNKVSNVKIESNGTNVTVTSKYTVFCTLYFKFKSILDILRENDTSNKLSNNLVGEMYRYQGTDNVNNWICFGTSKDCSKTKEDINKYMYRIIGVTPEGELKLIKENGINTTSSQASNYKNSLLRSELNGSKFLTNKNYMTIEWTYIIDTHTWLYGYAGSVSETNLYNGDYMYEIESGNKVVTFNSSLLSYPPARFDTKTKAWDESVDDKVGMLYLHDYLYAYPGGNPETKENAITSWIAPLNREYIMTLSETSTPGIGNSTATKMYSLYPDGIHDIYINEHAYNYGNCTSGSNSCATSCNNTCAGQTDIGTCMTNCYNDCFAKCDQYKAYYRPVFYLTPDIILKEGTTGEQDNPYIINI